MSYSFYPARQRPRDYIGEIWAAERIRRAIATAQTVEHNFLIPLCDMGVSAIEGLYNEYKDTPLYNARPKFKELLDALYEQSCKRYELISSSHSNKQFYADILDGAQEYLTPQVNKLYQELYDLYKNHSPAIYYKLAATITATLCMTQSEVLHANSLYDNIQEAADVKLYGLGRFIMQEETALLQELVNKYGSFIKGEAEKELHKVTNAFMVATRAKHTVFAAAKYAEKYHPGELEVFKKNAEQLYEIKWDD